MAPVTSWHECWLTYAPPPVPLPAADRALLAVLASPGARHVVTDSALAELRRGIEAMVGVAPETRGQVTTGCVVVGDFGTLAAAGVRVDEGRARACGDGGYLVERVATGGRDQLLLAGPTREGALYAAHHLLGLIRTGAGVPALPVTNRPRIVHRMIDHWDNPDGSIERGYAGRSLFFRDDDVVEDLTRVAAWARLLASIGVNEVAVNNVNVRASGVRFLGDRLAGIARLAEVFRAQGIRLYLSVSFASPITLGDLGTADPLDPDVRRWWADRAAHLYEVIPDFGGLLVKADSEGQPGPHTYGRTHAEGANMLAAALERHGGRVYWRCFVYNHRQDWRDRGTDRARAAYDHFLALDGSFAPNIVLQIKNGPVDFQVREPVSPLLLGLSRTNRALELQVTQEYTGQQRHLCCLLPQWRSYLDFASLAGTLAGGRENAVVGVSNTGDDAWWTGHPLAQANLFGFGRLAWDPDTPTRPILEEWARRTVGCDPAVVDRVTHMQERSWEIYESYTAPLGVGWMVTPGTHDGPSPEGYEYTAWGTYHFADRDGIGVDRTARTGTGYTTQYPAAEASRFEDLASCPDELLLFFHHVSYTHRLQSGKTVIQHIYDSRFQGVEEVRALVTVWKSLEGAVERALWAEVLNRLEDQVKRAVEWRDVINTYFHRKTGVPDERGRMIY